MMELKIGDLIKVHGNHIANVYVGIFLGFGNYGHWNTINVLINKNNTELQIELVRDIFKISVLSSIEDAL